MRPTDTVRLLALVTQIAPAQRVDEYTADAWYLVLGHLDYDTAKAAVIAVAQRERFIAPSDVVQEARRLRAARIEQVSPEAVPDADPDDPAAYLAALKAGRFREPDADRRRRPLAAAMRAAIEQRNAVA